MFSFIGTTNQLPQIDGSRGKFFLFPATVKIPRMALTNLFLKVEVEHAPEETPQRIGEQLCRQLLKLYGVREAELTSFTAAEE